MRPNFTNLADIIDLDEPGNDNEHNETHIENFPAPEREPDVHHGMNVGEFDSIRDSIRNTIRGGGNNMDMRQRFNNTPKQSNLMPNMHNNFDIASNIPNNFNKPLRQNYTGPYQGNRKRQSFNNRRQAPIVNQQYTHQDTPIPIESLNPERLDDMTEKYEQLCEICNKIYHNNNQIHTMYIVVITSMFIIIMMLLKKVLK